MVVKNFFADIFATGLSFLIEDGIYERWARNNDVAIYQKELGFRKVNESRDLSDAEATTVKHVAVAFIIYFGMSLVSMAVFISEFKHSLIMSWRDGWSRTLVTKYTDST